MPRGLTSRPGFTAFALGMFLLVELLATRLLLRADNDFVYFLGQRINYVCAAKQRFGVPCPTCGLTRGFVLTVHGRIPEAWRLSPTGPLAAMGMFALGTALLVLAVLQPRRKQVQIASMARWLRAGALAYVAAGTIIWAGSWLSVVMRLRGHP
jgi:hypothetical protein